MPLVTLVYGVILIAIGAVGFFSTGSVHVTALIPAFIGLPITGLGLLARSDKYLKHAMHGAAVLALLATLGTARGLLKLPALIGGGEVARPAAVIAQSLVAVLSIVFLILCVRSFRAARRARNA